MSKKELKVNGDIVHRGFGYQVKKLTKFVKGDNDVPNNTTNYIQQQSDGKHCCHLYGTNWILSDLASKPIFDERDIFYVLCNTCGTYSNDQIFYSSTEESAKNKGYVWFNHVHLRQQTDPVKHTT